MKCQIAYPAQHFGIDTVDAADLSWAPDGRAISVWDTVLENRLVVYSADGRRLACITPYADGLGIRASCVY